MIRLAPLVLAFAATAAAAPVPPPTEKERLAKHWGKFEGQGEYELMGNRLTLRTAGQPAIGLRFGAKNTSMPRVSRTVRGDFEATVTVLYATPPHKDARTVAFGPESRAGLFLTGGGFDLELNLYQAHHKNNGVAGPLQRCVWLYRMFPDGSGGGSMLDDAPVEKSTHLRVTRRNASVTAAYSFDGRTWSEPRAQDKDLELPDEMTVGVSFSHSTYQALSADFHAFTVEKPKAAKKE
ncbi:hypothetical protein [Frigoriglobus tundricola]|uniref:Beta-xylosidase C-terminal Concanavalin A-like domain-containing protein n=1 Tax=Frigoriglobus tundricola TaxID=2774151 RepID=A0A6M5YVI0_9BACT|nr:hypothetical protein [Frigoriglobus tundricola]QJW97510.1 hypothetical protein FTUN_5084 [Frigoriglobus tundricola]